MKALFRNLLGAMTVLLFLGIPETKSAPTGPPPDPTPLPSTYYVSLSGTHVYPFADWASAATNIQAAVDATHDGDTIIIGDGHYMLETEVEVTNNITVLALNGPETTIIDGQASVRCFNLGNTHSVVSGLTITNGQAMHQDGGGVFCSGPNPVATNCVITGNSCQWLNPGNGSITGGSGGGMYKGTAIDCIFAGNKAGNGGGMDGGKAIHCTFNMNEAVSIGGGLAGNSTAIDCLISDNHASVGGGIMGGAAVNCMISGNSASQGGGLAHASAVDCRVMDNTAINFGGGLHSGFATNCLVVGNEAGHTGGGMFGFEAVNCTFIGNTAPKGSAVSDSFGIPSAVKNCILWNNPATGSDSIYNSDVHYSCSPDLIAGMDGNITNAPMFMNPAVGDFRLLATSPCIDAGSNALVLVDMDIDGNPRIMDGDFDGTPVVDMGAFEFQAIMVPPGSISLPPVNLKSKGRTPVTVVSSGEFDASSINPASIRLAGSAPVYRVPRARKSLMVLFNTADFDLDHADNEAMFMAQTWSGQYVVGMVPVKLVPCKKQDNTHTRPVVHAETVKKNEHAVRAKKSK